MTSSFMFEFSELIQKYKDEIKSLNNEIKDKVIDEQIESNIKYTEMLTLKRVLKDLRGLLK